MAEHLDENETIEEKQDNPVEVDKTDKDIMEKPKKELAGGIGAEEYDILPELESHVELADTLEEKDCVMVEYSYNGDEVREGLGIFQATTILKRNVIYSVVLILVFAVYMMNILKNPNETFSIFLAVMCIAVLGFIWFLPKNHIKKHAQIADTNQMKFTMAIYDNCVRVGEDSGSSLLTYNKEITVIYETPNLFMVCAGKERIFILPKRCLTDEQQEKARGFFKNGVGERYLEKNA